MKKAKQPGLRALLAILMLVAPKAWAHGEQTLALYFLALLVIPASLVLLVPWHRLSARIAAASVYALLTAIACLAVLPSIPVGTPAWVELLVMLAPAGTTLGFMVLLKSEMPNTE